MRRSGAQIVWEMLRHEGVDVVFGMPGGGIMPTYHPRQDYGLRHVLIRHEQAAAHAADGYARVSGRVGVAIATSGPGATNLTTGIATAMLDSIPLVCITGQVPSSVIGSDAFQEADITGITLPITKHNYLVTHVDDLAETIHEAFYVARSGRPGPVLIDLPKDVQIAETDAFSPQHDVQLPGYHPTEAPDSVAVGRAAALVNASVRPVILAGHGVVMAEAEDELRILTEKADIPVATTLLGKGCLPDDHPLSLGMMGMHGSASANQAIQEADLLIAIGMRFDDRVTGRLADFAAGALKIHLEFDASEIGKNVPVDVGVLGDLRQSIRGILDTVEESSRSPWHEQIAVWRADSEDRDLLTRPEGETLAAPHVIDAIRREMSEDAIVVADVGQNQMWAAQYFHADRGRAFITSGGLGTMGYALPAAMGAQIAAPEAEVWVIAGDGGFQMNVQELATIVQEKLPIRIAILNNGFLGMVRQWQEFFFDKRYESTPLLNPDFVKLAEAYGIRGWRARTPEESRRAITSAQTHDGPTLIDFQVAGEGKEGNVYPMVPAGAALDEMIRRPVAVKAETRRSGG